MNYSVLILCLAAVFLAGCESIFGKETGERGALPGKRADVFSEGSSLKPDADAGTSVDVPSETDITQWTMAGGSLARVQGNVALAANAQSSWSTSIGTGSHDNGPLLAAPVIDGGRIYTVDSSGTVSAYSTQNGDRQWSKSVPEQAPDEGAIFGAGLAITDGKLVVSTSYGFVVALDASSGKQLWSRNILVPIRSGPVVHDGKVYVITMTNTLQELSLADGSLGWNHSGITETASLLGMASPTFTEGLVIAPYSSGEVFGLRALNGRMVWEENLGGSKRTGTLPAMADIQAQPVLDEGRVYITSHAGRFVALDARTGRRVWEADAGSTSTPWVAGNTIYVVTTENQLVALARDTGRVRWVKELLRYVDPEDKSRQVRWVGPVLAGGQLWLANSQGDVKTHNPQNGSEKSSFSVGSPVFIPPVVAGRTLYVLSDNGTLHAFK